MAKIRCPLNEAAHHSPNQAGLVSEHGSFLYTEVEQCVVASQRLLERNGVGSGDYVGLLVENSWEEVILFWALLRVGAVLCPLPASSSLESLQQIVETLNIKHIIARDVFNIVNVQQLKFADLTGFTAKFQKENRPSYDLETPAVILMKVSDTGDVDYILHSIASCYYAALGGNAALPLRSNQRWLMKPMFLLQGIDVLFRCATTGAGVVVTGSLVPNYEDVNKFEITHITTIGEAETQTLLDELSGRENELCYVQVSGDLSPLIFEEAARAAEVRIVIMPGTIETGNFATVDRDLNFLPLKYHRLEEVEKNIIRVCANQPPLGLIREGNIMPLEECLFSRKL